MQAPAETRIASSLRREKARPLNNRYETYLEDGFNALEACVDKTTGFFPAAFPAPKNIDSAVQHLASEGLDDSADDHMRHFWTRDGAEINMALIKSVIHLKSLSETSPLVDKIATFVKWDITTQLDFMFAHPDRWAMRFNWGIDNNQWDTELKDETNAPEVHMLQNGNPCRFKDKGSDRERGWDQNQPESWGDLLIAVGMAVREGIIDSYTKEQMDVIRAMVSYLTRLMPWKSKASPMWEGKSLTGVKHKDAAIAKGLDAVYPLFNGVDDEGLRMDIDYTIRRSMFVVKGNYYEDYEPAEENLVPEVRDWPEEKRRLIKRNLATMITMSYPDFSSDTELPFIPYITDNMGILEIGEAPGAIRFKGDAYKNEGFGEARWLMAEPVIAFNFCKAAEQAEEWGQFKVAKHYRRIAADRLDRFFDVIDKCGYAPELFISIDPQSVSEDEAGVFRYVVDGVEKVYKPIGRGLYWNTGLLMEAAALRAELEPEIGEEKAAA